jgi:3-oxoacyl-[acyl-carrier protein] reductase
VQSQEILSGKSALVTGGARSIGTAIALRLAAEGAAVAITYSRSSAEAEAIVRTVKSAGGRALAIHADAGDPTAARAAVNRTAEEFGSIDILVNNAGITLPNDIQAISASDYDRMIAVNVTGVFVAAIVKPPAQTPRRPAPMSIKGASCG